MSDKNDENLPNENGLKPLKPKWWDPFWILMVISMVGSGVFSYFFLHGEFIRIIIYEIIFSIVLCGAYYIRIRPSKRVNKVVYILFGITPIGFGLSIIYALFCGITNFAKFIMSFEPFGPCLHMGIIIVLFTIGGFIGNWIGKKRDYRLPLSPY